MLTFVRSKMNEVIRTSATVQRVTCYFYAYLKTLFYPF